MRLHLFLGVQRQTAGNSYCTLFITLPSIYTMITSNKYWFKSAIILACHPTLIAASFHLLVSFVPLSDSSLFLSIFFGKVRTQYACYSHYIVGLVIFSVRTFFMFTQVIIQIFILLGGIMWKLIYGRILLVRNVLWTLIHFPR